MSNILDTPNLRCVPVIASFSSNGEIAPLYTNINSIQLKIESFKIKNEFDLWIQFSCKVIDNNIQKQIILIYNTREHAWFAAIEYFNL